MLLSEAIAGLEIKEDGIYVDATYGRGGHSRAILEGLGSQGRLLAIDKDPEAIQSAQQTFGDDPRFVIEQGSFVKLKQFVEQQGCFEKVDGVLLEIGRAHV